MGLQRYTGKYHRATQTSEGVLLLEFNRPPVNAFHDDMWLEMKTILEAVSQDPYIRAIVLTSALDKHFTAGLDLQGAALTLQGRDDLDPARRAMVLHQHVLEFQSAISSLALARQPVIVALYGTCMGLAIDLASACDIRLTAENAIFSIAEVNVGLAADIGTLQRFPKIIGNDSKARELALTGRRFDAREAKDIGFVSEIVSGGRDGVIKTALAVAKSIAEKSPIAVIGTKHLLNHSRDHTVQEGLEYTAAWNMAMLQATDTTTAMKAVLAKKTPSFTQLPPHPHPKAKL